MFRLFRLPSVTRSVSARRKAADEAVWFPWTSGLNRGTHLTNRTSLKKARFRQTLMEVVREAGADKVEVPKATGALLYMVGSKVGNFS